MLGVLSHPPPEDARTVWALTSSTSVATYNQRGHRVHTVAHIQHSSTQLSGAAACYVLCACANTLVWAETRRHRRQKQIRASATRCRVSSLVEEPGNSLPCVAVELAGLCNDEPMVRSCCVRGVLFAGRGVNMV
jgi:hypothetical protein